MVAAPLRDLTADERRTFVDDGVVCARQAMPSEWLELTAEAIDRNITSPGVVFERMFKAISPDHLEYLITPSTTTCRTSTSTATAIASRPGTWG
jgi:hypothetical protein